MMSFDDNDPNWLAILLCGLHEIDDRRQPLPVPKEPSRDDKLLKRFCPVLDSIARLMIYEPENQVTAVAFRPTSAAHPPTFVLAQNTGVTDHVVKYITDLVSHLRMVRELYLQDNSVDKSFPERDDVPVVAGNAPLQAELNLGESTAIYHCWNKIKQRFSKDSRDERFRNLVADVLEGVAADQRADCGAEEKRTLRALQSLSAADHKHLQKVSRRIASIGQFLEHTRGQPDKGTGAFSEADGWVLVGMRMDFHAIGKSMKDAPHLWPLCTDYIRVRCPSEEDMNDDQKAALQALTRQQREAMRPFDVTKWLSKVVSVTADYLVVRSVALSSTMAGALFDNRPLTVVRVPKARAPAKIAEISEEQLKATLVKVGWADIGNEEYAELVDKLRRTLKKSTGQTSAASVHSANGTISGRVHPFVHCECALLAHLHDQGMGDIVAYVGVSKLSCWLCAMYFACYREVTGTVINTRGTHGRLVQWQMPALDDPDVGPRLREKMREKLVEKLKVRAAEVRTHHRNLSQITTASLPGSKELMELPEEESEWNETHKMLAAGMLARNKRHKET
ncbi:hypothetical protein BN946_scf184921.g2 [Trametes cinnabarina]|uniref:Uncharacterized protein n=1 Tax=Pycnoporus cinnabarinus TaxID=5643 RepID=A0A060SNJ0_PYCCI|nr:hypothetical protein BN946_scf184921.g2 [Trametes cinnabarina]